MKFSIKMNIKQKLRIFVLYFIDNKILLFLK
jgi:hypothetical protein